MGWSMNYDRFDERKRPAIYEKKGQSLLGCPDENPSMLQSDLGPFNNVKRNKTKRRREKKVSKRERMCFRISTCLSERERVRPIF